MGNQTDYFNRVGYQATYDIGDRVIGKWNGIPFVGTVGNDRLIIVIVKHNQVRKLPQITDKK